MGNHLYSNFLGGIGGQGAMTATGLQALYNQQANYIHDTAAMWGQGTFQVPYATYPTGRRNVIAAGFEVLYKFKVFEKVSSKTVIAETSEKAKQLFFKTFEGEEKQPRIVSIEETVVTL